MDILHKCHPTEEQNRTDGQITQSLYMTVILQMYQYQDSKQKMFMRTWKFL